MVTCEDGERWAGEPSGLEMLDKRGVRRGKGKVAANAPYPPYSKICYRVRAAWHGEVCPPSPCLNTQSSVQRKDGVWAIKR